MAVHKCLSDKKIVLEIRLSIFAFFLSYNLLNVSIIGCCCLLYSSSIQQKKKKENFEWRWWIFQIFHRLSEAEPPGKFCNAFLRLENVQQLNINFLKLSKLTQVFRMENQNCSSTFSYVGALWHVQKISRIYQYISKYVYQYMFMIYQKLSKNILLLHMRELFFTSIAGDKFQVRANLEWLLQKNDSTIIVYHTSCSCSDTLVDDLVKVDKREKIEKSW